MMVVTKFSLIVLTVSRSKTIEISVREYKTAVPREVHLSHERESRENVKIVYRLKLSRFWTKPLQGTTEDFWFLWDKQSFVKRLC